MSQYVTDTHALIWHLYADPKLSPTCQSIFDRTDAGEDTIFVPSITLIEILDLAEKKRIPANAVETSIALIASEAKTTRLRLWILLLFKPLSELIDPPFPNYQTASLPLLL